MLRFNPFKTICRLLPAGVLPAVLLISFLFGGGLVLGLLQSLGYQPGNGFGNLSLSHFSQLFNGTEFLSSLLLTFYISITSTLIAALISLLLALLLIYLQTRNLLIHFFLQLPLAVPHLVVGIAMLLLLSPTGLLSRILMELGIISSSSSFPVLVYDDWCISIILVYVWKEVPFITLILLAVLKNLGTELLEVGATLNSTPLQRFFYILLPLIAPGLAAGSLIVFAYTFGAFEIPYLLGKSYPVPLPVWSYKNYTDIDLLLRPQGIAIAMIITAIITLLLSFTQFIIFNIRKLEGKI